MSIDGFFFYLQKSVCIKSLQMIVIFPESPQIFAWSESQNPGWGGRTLNVEVIGMLVGNFFRFRFKALKISKLLVQYPKKNTNFTENVLETCHFYSIWKMSRP